MSWKSLLIVCFCSLAIVSTGCGKDDGDKNNGSGPVAENDAGVTDKEDSGSKVEDDSGSNVEDDTGSTDENDVGDDTGVEDDTGGNTTPVTLEEFVVEAPKLMAEMVCKGAFECPEIQPPEFVLIAGGFTTLEECVGNFPKVMAGGNGGDIFKTEREAMEAGRMEFDAAKAAICFGAINDGLKECTSLAETEAGPLAICDNVFAPKVEKDGPCGSDKECVSGNCGSPDDAAGECFGRCGDAIELAKEGEACSRGGCVEGLFCVESIVPGETGEVCVKAGARQEDEPCDGFQNVCSGDLICTLQDQICAERAPMAASGDVCYLFETICTPGLTCVDIVFDTDEMKMIGVCGAHRSEGEACGMEFECKFDQYCSGDLTDRGECETKKANGESCEVSAECESSHCDDDTEKCADDVDEDEVCEIPSE